MNRIMTTLFVLVCTTMSAYAGVVVEGGAIGVEPIKTIKYVPNENVFVLNDSATLENPVSSDELVEIIDAINFDERIGVSVTLNDELIVYGKLHKRSKTAGKLEDADNFIRSVVFAEYSRLRKFPLPQNYKPVQVVSRERSSVIYLQLSEFEFSKSSTRYIPSNVRAEVMLIPMATYTAPDGGYLPDYDALEKGVFQKEDKANADHISMHKQEYLQLPPLRQAIKVGQASAIVRFLRDSGINMSELSRSLIEGKAITLVGKDNIDKVEIIEFSKPKEESASIVAEAESEFITEEAVKEEIIQEQGQEVIAKVEPASGSDYSESIRQIFLIDKIIGNTGKVKLSRKSVNDGSYIAYRRNYLKGITDPENIDLSKTPEEFQVAFNKHIEAWEHVLSWLEGKHIEDGKDEFASFYKEHGQFRTELKETYNACKEIAAEYQVEN